MFPRFPISPCEILHMSQPLERRESKKGSIYFRFGHYNTSIYVECQTMSAKVLALRKWACQRHNDPNNNPQHVWQFQDPFPLTVD